MSAEQQPLAKLPRVAFSILLVGHLLAVVLPPLSFQTRGPLGLSPSVATAFEPLEGYSQFLYIDRGYAFFAPDPGPSHLIQAAVTSSNSEPVEIIYPDLDQQWPRLLYHRHFMLTEFLEEIYQPPGPPPELIEVDPDEAELWVRARRYEHVRQSVVDHLKHENPGREVAIRRIEHLIPDLIEYRREPIPLDDPRLYRVILDQPIELDDAGNLVAPLSPPESIPVPEAAVVEQASEQASEDASGERSEPPADAASDSAGEPQDDGKSVEDGVNNAAPGTTGSDESESDDSSGQSDQRDDGASP